MTSQPLRILHLNASSTGGAFVAAQRLNDALNGLDGVSSEHWVFDGGEGDFYLWANTWIKKKWAFGLHALEKLDFLSFEANKSIRFAFSHGKTGVNVANWKAVQDADIIHLHWVNKGFVSLNGLEDLLGLGKKIVWTCHDMWPFTGGCYHPRGCDNFTRDCGNCQYLKQPCHSDLSNQVFKAKKRIFSNAGGRLQFVTPSAWLKRQADNSGIVNELIGIGGALAIPEIKVVPNPIDTDYFKPRGLNSMKSPMNYPFVLMFAAANLGNPAKGFAEFRSVCNGLVELGFNDIMALVVGENRLANSGLGLKCAVKELGFISDAKQMRDAYWQADVYVTTSHEENLPTTIMESLSCGVPVAAFAVGGIPEMISPSGVHQSGWLAEKMDVKSLIQGIASYMRMEPSKRIKMQEASRNAAVANYGSLSIAQQYLSLYSNVPSHI
ncbi:MAG: glycosyltransferase [Bacteroidetes bacterium]|nr:glycosyltransferase [Bacteroidota bacterium]MDA1225169.1 glycosyltransferase [Bacteroidota bacterium]